MNTKTKVSEWKSQLPIDGKAAVRALVGRSASLGHLSAAEPDDAIDDIMGEQDFVNGIFNAFDESFLSLAMDYRDRFLRESVSKNASGLLRLDIVLRLVRRMRPPKTVLDFHRGFDS